jgi:hypothetical protein
MAVRKITPPEDAPIRTLDWWRANGEDVQDHGEYLTVRCPVHGGVSLTVGPGIHKDGHALVHCKGDTDCSYADILAALGDESDGADERAESPPPPGFTPGPDALQNLAGYCGISKERLIELNLPISDGGKGEPVFTWPDGSRKRRHWSAPKATWDQDNKHRTVWPVEEKMPEEAWFCEGEPDTIVLRALGVAAYSLGSAGDVPTSDEWRGMHDRGLRRPLLAGDADKPGRKGNIAKMATAIEAGLSVATVLPPDYDPLTGRNKDWRDWYLNGGATLPVVDRPASAVQSMSDYLAAHVGDTEAKHVIQGLAYRGIISLLAGPMKGGKTTLIRHGIECLRDGRPFLGRWEVDVNTPVLLLTEEGAVTVRLNLGHLEIDLISRRDREPSKWTLAETVAVALDWLRLNPGGLIVVDTYDKWAGVIQENDSAENVAAITAFYPLAEMGGAVLLVHHSRKGGGDYGEGIRGSGAILGAVDHAVELKHVNAGSDRRRFETHGRILEDTRRLLDFDRGTLTYSIVDEAAEENAELLSWLEGIPRRTDSPEGETQADLESRWDMAPKSGDKRITKLRKADLLTRELIKNGRVKAWHYWRADTRVVSRDQA